MSKSGNNAWNQLQQSQHFSFINWFDSCSLNILFVSDDILGTTNITTNKKIYKYNLCMFEFCFILLVFVYIWPFLHVSPQYELYDDHFLFVIAVLEIESYALGKYSTLRPIFCFLLYMRYNLLKYRNKKLLEFVPCLFITLHSSLLGWLMALSIIKYIIICR